MSHPYWPQPQYLYRPGGRITQAPVPHSFGGFEGDDYAGARYETVGTPYPHSPRARVPTYGSLSPKLDWSTPGYIRDEPAGLGAFGEDTGCVGGLTGYIAKYLAERLKSAVGYPESCPDILSEGGFACNAKKVALDSAPGAISGVIGAALSGISGDLSDVGIRQQVHDAIANRISSVKIIGLDFDILPTLLSALDSALTAAIGACGSFLAAQGGGGCAMTDANMQAWCAAGDTSCLDETPESFYQWCVGHGYPWGGAQHVEMNILPIQPTLVKTKLPTAALEQIALYKAGGMQHAAAVTAQPAPAASSGGGGVAVVAGLAALAYLLMR